MNALERHNLKAAEYRSNAAAAESARNASGLDLVRASHERAAQKWTEMAEAEDYRAAQSQIFRGTPRVEDVDTADDADEADSALDMADDPATVGTFDGQDEPRRHAGD